MKLFLFSHFYKVYNDELPYNLDNDTGIVETVKLFCYELNHTSKKFLNELIKKLHSKLNTLHVSLAEEITIKELKEKAKNLGIKGYSKINSTNKEEWIKKLSKSPSKSNLS